MRLSSKSQYGLKACFILAQNYPVLYQSLYQLIHGAGERINGLMAARHSK